MSDPTDSSGTQKYWIDGLPFSGVRKAGNNAGTQKYWMNGLPDPDIFSIINYTLSINDAVHSHTSNSVVFGQNHIIVINNSSHVSASTDSVFNQVHILSINNAANVCSSDNTSLPENVALTVSDSVHACISQQSTFGVYLLVDSVNHATSSDIATLKNRPRYYIPIKQIVRVSKDKQASVTSDKPVKVLKDNDKVGAGS